jgi:murein L,D-transpeptidase YcbB/YkuD
MKRDSPKEPPEIGTVLALAHLRTALRNILAGGLLVILFGLSPAFAQDATAPAPLVAPAPAAPPPAATTSPAPVPIPTITTVPGAAALPTGPAAGAPPAAPPAPKKIVHLAPPLETALSDRTTPMFEPETFFLTAKASERYATIADSGGWPVIPFALRPGAKGKTVAMLRQRLAAEGDLDPAKAVDTAAAIVWDDELTTAVKHFQMRMGLRRTGIVAGATLKAMNISARERFKQLASSAQRLAGGNFSFGDRYVAVNLPSTSVEAVENGKVAHHYVAIVGDIEHPSPEISAHISVINLNPTWTVPTSIIKKEIIPHMQRDPGYLTRAKIRILDGSGAEVDPARIDWNSQRAVNYTLRQDSGASNSLGAIRIGMPNKLAVYMHDTPSKRLFGADYRFLSHGCVRVQGVYDLAEWLLQGTPNVAAPWDKAALEAKVKAGAREDVKLTKSVPVIWVYMTGWADSDGVVNFRDDVYGVDTVGDATASVDPAVQVSPLAAPAAVPAPAATPTPPQGLLSPLAPLMPTN